MAVVFTDNQYYQDIADAIRAKNGSSDTYLPSEMATAIEDISGGGEEEPEYSEADVIFFDYDGTVLYEYTGQQALALTEMPPVPTHTDMVSQGWNFTLEQIKSYVNDYGACRIGTMYTTEIGVGTKLFCHFSDGYLSPTLTIAPYNGTITIDWGDGSATDSLTGTNSSSAYTTNKSVSHTYASAGDYTISLIRVESTARVAVNGNANYHCSYILSDGIDFASETSYQYRSALKGIHWGSDFRVAFSDYSLADLPNLEYINIPSYNNWNTSDKGYTFYNDTSLKSIAFIMREGRVPNPRSNMFYGCTSLKYVSLPDATATLETSIFQNCTSLKTLIFPNGITTIPSYCCDGCSNLERFNIAKNVTYIGSNAFTSLYPKSLTIPNMTLSSSSFGSYFYFSLKELKLLNSSSTTTNLSADRCYTLRKLTLPTNITTFKADDFDYCYALETITIPETVTAFNTYNFRYTYSLKECHLLPTTPPTIGTNTFASVRKCVFYVPYSADHSILEAYKSATNWSKFASFMQEEPAS